MYLLLRVDDSGEKFAVGLFHDQDKANLYCAKATAYAKRIKFAAEQWSGNEDPDFVSAYIDKDGAAKSENPFDWTMDTSNIDCYLYFSSYVVEPIDLLEGWGKE